MATSAFAGVLARVSDPESVARLVLDRATALVGVEFASVLLVEDGVGTGLLARARGADLDGFGAVRLDLKADASAVASVVFEAAPLAVYDVLASPVVDRKLASQVGAKSAVFVPLVADDEVVGVLAVAATGEQRHFTRDEIGLLAELAADSAPAFVRARSLSALGRERLVASIARMARSEADLETLLAAIARDAARALDCRRCLIRLGPPGEGGVVAEWDAAGASSVARGVDAERALVTRLAALGEVLGELVLEREDASAWSPDDVALAEALAGEVGLVIRAAGLGEQNRRRRERESALLHAAQAVTSELEPHLVLRRLVDEVAKVLLSDAADFYLLDADRRVLRCVAAHGLGLDQLGHELPADRGLEGEALARNRPVISTEYGRAAEDVPSSAHEGFIHAIVAPVVSGGKPRGVLGVRSRSGERTFDAIDAEVLEAFAGLASLALGNAEAFEDRSRQARVQRGFYRIASALGHPLSLAATLDAVAQAASEALGGDFAAVLMPRLSQLELVGSQGLPEQLERVLAGGLPAEERALPRAAAEERILAAPALAADGRFERAWKAAAEQAGYHSLLAIPLGARPNEEAGGLVIVFFAEERRFSDDDLELARQLASAARGALDRSSLYEDERRARSLAQQLARTGSLLATELDPAGVLGEVVRQAPALGDVDACLIRVLDGEELVVSAAQGEATESLLGTRSPATGWLSGDVVQSRAPLALADAAADDRLARADPLVAAGYRAFLGVPLAAPEGALHGVLAVYARRPKPWREEEVEALLALAGNASAALSNAELYQRVALAKEQADAILSNIADGIVAVDGEGSVVLWNSAAEQISGVPAAEALGRTPTQVLGRNLESGSDMPAGDRLVSIVRGGDEVWLSVTEAIMRDPAGSVTGRVYAFRDISTDRLVEELKSEFVSTVSQKLRRPLTSIYGFAETLLRRDVLFGEQERRTFLGYIASESERLTTIVDELLSVAQLDTGDLQVNLAPTDVRSVVADVAALSVKEVDGRYELALDLPAEPLVAAADADKLRQVLGNLVENAIKYSPPGSRITVAARWRRGLIEVSVADQGIGIASAERERIFRKFYRGEAGASREGFGSGTGLGLFIAQGLVRAMGGGQIEVDSTEGEGSTFTFALPLAQARDDKLVREPREKRV